MYAINYTSPSIRNISRVHGGFELLSWSQASLHNSCTYRFSAWRPLKHVVREAPLAFCDFTSVDPVDLIATDRPSREYVGEVYYMKHNSAQKWYWLSQQTPDELSLFMSYDSDPGEGEATCKAPEVHSRWILLTAAIAFKVCPHSAFQLQDGPPPVERRESVEIRLIVITRKTATSTMT